MSLASFTNLGWWDQDLCFLKDILFYCISLDTDLEKMRNQNMVFSLAPEQRYIEAGGKQSYQIFFTCVIERMPPPFILPSFPFQLQVVCHLNILRDATSFIIWKIWALICWQVVSFHSQIEEARVVLRRNMWFLSERLLCAGRKESSECPDPALSLLCLVIILSIHSGQCQ